MNIKTAKSALKENFGYKSFHPTQEKAIKAILAGKNVFVLMPTGGGKSLCYQIPALIMPGTAIIVSPLIALMKDQVDALKASGIAAEYLNSSLDHEEQAAIIERAKKGALDMLYVSAERLVSPGFTRLLKQIKISLFAIDEAHCISAWGHDFRPDYTQLSHLNSNYPNAPIIALTATADAATRKDILAQLELPNPLELVDSFDRPNISLTVRPGKKRLEQIKAFLKNKQNQSGIIYCLTRKKTEQLAEQLQKSGYSAASYHAGMSTAERSRVQQSFSRDKTQIVCATIAFGMGIDKLNVRWVIHYNLPKNIESYYQQIGRAGRDGAPAEALLFYTYLDVTTLKRFTINSTQKDVQLAKLDRMKEFSEGVVCRRRTLLYYFGENYEGDCANCDVCDDTISTFDGSEIAHLALKTLRTSKKALTAKDLVNILSNSKLKVNYASWNFYVGQLKNAGLINTVFDQDQQLTVSELGREILAKKKKVELVKLDEFIERQEVAAKKTKPAPRKSAEYQNPLFEKLRKLRLEIAQEKKLPAYMIFSDKTLLEMAAEKPSNKKEMLAISGVGAVKWKRYGEQFLEVIGG